MQKPKKNELIRFENYLLRILDVKEESVLVIDCEKKSMPKWMQISEVPEYETVPDTLSLHFDLDSMDVKSRKFAHEHFVLIAPVLPFIGDKPMRDTVISRIAQESGYSKQTVRSYLCLYLAYQNIGALAPKQNPSEKELSQDEKNMRWALNKFYYNRNQNSLTNAYSMMLKEKYCENGVLLPEYPSIHQFRYFYRKTRQLQTYYISRGGLTDYQRNHRPLLGDGIQQLAPCIGYGMADSTICDIYLVNESGNLVGRPILTACVDVYSGLCYGYSLSWEGGVYSLRNLMLNMVTDKKEYCRRLGISLKKKEWDCDKLPGVLIADKGSEYDSGTFEQLTELGITIINLQSYRPELKGLIEQFFDVIQESYKPHLMGKGVIMPDFQQRGAHDYRKDACLTLKDFEEIIVRCIVFYNTRRVIENYPFTEDMLKAHIQPFSNCIWEYGRKQSEDNLITVSKEHLNMTLLPRTQGRFTRKGLIVNRLRYKCRTVKFTESYLSGGNVTVAYNPDDVTQVWLIDDSTFYPFELIESRFQGMSLSDTQEMKSSQKAVVKDAVKESLQAKIELIDHINTISNGKPKAQNTKDVKSTRKKEQRKAHVGFTY